MLALQSSGIPCIYIAIPVQDESYNLQSLYSSINSQTYRNFKLIVCVNQPDSWWQDPEKLHICRDNLISLQKFASWDGFPITIIDKCTSGKGWKGKHFGVGWARKTALDACREMSSDSDILLCLDADTIIKPRYLEAIADAMKMHPESVALAVPYTHQPADTIENERAILRYEIYMRYYAINLWRIKSPYSFTALGSAMAVRADAYTRIGGITPLKSGEDFYFLQKLRKYGELLFWCSEKAYPASRLSSRVFFGTGPALIKGMSGEWKSYPLYPPSLFDKVKETTDLFAELYTHDIQTPMDSFLKKIFKEEYIWEPLRSKKKQFVRACHEKVDALRILQFLKSITENDEVENSNNFRLLLSEYYSQFLNDTDAKWLETFSLLESENSILQKARELLIIIEEHYQKNHYFEGYLT